MTKPHKGEKTASGRRPETERIRHKRAEVAKFLLELIEKNSGLKPEQLEQITGTGADGINGKTGKNWRRWKTGERGLRPRKRHQISKIALRQGWINPPADERELSELECLAYGSVCCLVGKSTVGESTHAFAVDTWAQDVDEFFAKVERDRATFSSARAAAIQQLSKLHKFYLSTNPDEFLPEVSTNGQGWKELVLMIQKLEGLEIDHFEEALLI